MERLTEKHWINLDPWECCGQDNYCQRGCHDKGGCNNGCIVPKNYRRLAAYEDIGLSPEEIINLNNFEKSQCLKLLAKNGELQQEIEQLRAKIITDVVNSDLVKTYDGSALERADQYIEKLEQENEQLKRELSCEKATVSTLKMEGLHYSEFRENKAIQQLQAQAADMLNVLKQAREAFEHIAEYWYGTSTEVAMMDACMNNMETAKEAIASIDAIGGANHEKYIR